MILFRNHKFKRLVRKITALSFLFSFLPPPFLEAKFQNPAVSNLLSPIISQPSHFQIPEALGSIVESYQPDSNPRNWPLLIHIQDVHGNGAAQTNASLILKEIKKINGSTPLNVYIEGTAESIDTRWLQLWPNPRARKNIADLLLEQGRLNGEEYYSAADPLAIKIEGVEEPALYDSNLRARKLLTKHRSQINQSIAELKTKLSLGKKQLYSKELLALDAKSIQFANNKISIKEYGAFFLAKRKIESSAPKTIKFLSLLKIKLPTVDANREIKVLLEVLRTKPTGSINGSLRNPSITQIEQYELLIEFAHKLKISVPALESITRHLRAVKSIAINDLSLEIKGLENALWEGLLLNQSEAVKNMRKLDRELRLEEKFWNENFSPNDWQEYQQIKKINESANILNLPQEMRWRILQEEYYALALKRDDVLTLNALKKISAHPNPGKVSVLIAGGFHTSGIVRKLKANGVPYLVIRPQLTAKPFPLEPLKFTFTEFKNQFQNYTQVIATSDYKYSAPLASQLSSVHWFPLLKKKDAVYLAGSVKSDNEIKQFILEWKTNLPSTDRAELETQEFLRLEPLSQNTDKITQALISGIRINGEPAVRLYWGKECHQILKRVPPLQVLATSSAKINQNKTKSQPDPNLSKSWITGKTIVSSALASLIESYLLNPLVKMKTLMQTGEKNAPQGLFQVSKMIYKSKGFPGFWDGILASLGLSVTQRVCRFTFKEIFEKQFTHDEFGRLSLWQNLSLGAMTGAMEVSVLTPWELIQTRAQVAESTGRSAEIARAIIKKHGYRGLWWPYILGTAPSRITFTTVLFGSVEYTKSGVARLLTFNETPPSTGLIDFLGGSTSGFLCVLANHWMDVVRQRMNKNALTDPRYSSWFKAIKATRADLGWVGFTFGMNTRLLRIPIGQGLMFFTMGYIKKELAKLDHYFIRQPGLFTLWKKRPLDMSSPIDREGASNIETKSTIIVFLANIENLARGKGTLANLTTLLSELTINLYNEAAPNWDALGLGEFSPRIIAAFNKIIIGSAIAPIHQLIPNWQEFKDQAKLSLFIAVLALHPEVWDGKNWSAGNDLQKQGVLRIFDSIFDSFLHKQNLQVAQQIHRDANELSLRLDLTPISLSFGDQLNSETLIRLAITVQQ